MFSKTPSNAFLAGTSPQAKSAQMLPPRRGKHQKQSDMQPSQLLVVPRSCRLTTNSTSGPDQLRLRRYSGAALESNFLPVVPHALPRLRNLRLSRGHQRGSWTFELELAHCVMKKAMRTNGILFPRGGRATEAVCEMDALCGPF